MIPDLLGPMMREPFFAAPAPKSTGRDLFNPTWLERHLAESTIGNAVNPQDIQATLLELTARSICDMLDSAGGVFVCGGGAHNTRLMERLAELVSPAQVAFPVST